MYAPPRASATPRRARDPPAAAGRPAPARAPAALASSRDEDGDGVLSALAAEAAAAEAAADDAAGLRRGLADARAAAAAGRSPGAGARSRDVASAERAAEAAFADLLVTGGFDADDDDDAVAALAAGGRMGAEALGAKSAGPLGAAAGLLSALVGGAHIVRQRDGRL